MKPLSYRISRILTVLLISQVLIVLTGFYFAHRRFTERSVQERYEWIAHLDPIVYEELILHVSEGNSQARDLIIYEQIQKAKIKFATYYTVEQLKDFLRRQNWENDCQSPREKVALICHRKDQLGMVGIIPLIQGQSHYGFYIQEADKIAVQPLASFDFLHYVTATLLITFIFNILALYLYFKLSVNREVQKLIQLLDSVGSKEKWEKAHLPHFQTKEFALLRDHIVESMKTLKSFEREKNQAITEVEKTKIASQVAHDIRSPLMALDIMVGQLPQIPEDKRLLVRNAVGRIHDIANTLLQQNRTIGLSEQKENKESSSVQLLSGLMDTLITEKRIQYRSNMEIRIEAELGKSAYGVFAQVPPNEFKVVLSNLINNGVEAIEEKGSVTVSLAASPQQATLVIEDTGRGIPKDIIPLLMRKGFTYKKDGGSGLGLFHAQRAVQKWGGTLHLESTLQQGARVVLRLPRAPNPEWFVPSVEVVPNSVIVILDDDSSIHEVWQERFGQRKFRNAHLELIHFSLPEQLRDWFKKGNATHVAVQYLIDFEFLDRKENGLDIIEALGIENRSILVTSRYEEVRERCCKLKVQLIPKGMAGSVPLNLIDDFDRHDAILIDDDPLVHQMWELSSKRRKKKVDTFFDVNSFFKKAKHYPTNTPVYIDSLLGEDVRGEVISQEIRKLGFTKIYLCTGLDGADTSPSPWLTGIVGKNPPWE